jgi:hypothetical protein
VHAVHVVAVEAVEAHPHGVHEVPGLLQVPGQGVALEAVEEHGEAARPVRVVHVDRIDAFVAQGRGAALGSLTDP